MTGTVRERSGRPPRTTFQAMEHRGFFKRVGPFTVSQIAELTGAVVAGGRDGARPLHDIRPLHEAGPEHLSFLDNRKYLTALKATRAGACFISERFADRVPTDAVGLVTREPYRAFAQALALFYPDAAHPMIADGGGPALHPDAAIEDGAVIQPGAVIGPHAQIGARTVIAAGAVIGHSVTIGRDGFIGPNANISHALVGDRVIIHAGASIGQDGFGFAMGAGGHLKVPQIGRVIIQDDVEIGANSTVDRGALADTVIGEGTKIDNLVQIGHNVVIGRHCVLAGQVGISGSTVLEDFVVIGGQAGLAGHIRIGAGAQVAATSGVTHSIPARERWVGAPAKPIARWSREIALVALLGETLRGTALARLKQMLAERK